MFGSGISLQTLLRIPLPIIPLPNRLDAPGLALTSFSIGFLQRGAEYESERPAEIRPKKGSSLFSME
jgi:hypothetical protein